MVSPKFKRFFVKLSLVECVSISLKFRRYFVKLIFTKFKGFFAKLSSIDCRLISIKFEGFFIKFVSQLFLTVGLADLTAKKFWPTWLLPGARKCTRFSIR